MGAAKIRAHNTNPGDIQTSEGVVRVASKTLVVRTGSRTDLVNISEEIRDFVAASRIGDGYVQVCVLHTTAGLFVNEWQEALLSDVRSLIERIVPRSGYYMHNDPQYSDCDRNNADAHLRNLIIGHALSIPVRGGELVLGRWQSIILAEFDGPNDRNVFMQAFGV